MNRRIKRSEVAIRCRIGSGCPGCPLLTGFSCARSARVPGQSAAVVGALLVQVRAAFFDPVVAVLEEEGIRPVAHYDARARFGREVEALLDLVLGEAFGPPVVFD